MGEIGRGIKLFQRVQEKRQAGNQNATSREEAIRENRGEKREDVTTITTQRRVVDPPKVMT